MAYFRCVGGVGGGAVLTLTYSSEFYGETITATDGTKTVTKVAPSTGTMDITLPESGTWVVSATIDGQTYSTSVTVDIGYSATLFAIPNGSTVTPTDDIQTWLKCAGITDKTTYTTLSDVLGDTDTLIALCADSNACDYMARSTNWASGVAADSTAMLIVGKYNYCANALLGNSTWRTAICGSTYFEYVLDTKVPTMTSNTTPSGVVSCSSATAAAPAWKMFDNNSSPYWESTSASNQWVEYQFSQAVTVCQVMLQSYGGGYGPNATKVQAYVNGDWEDVISQFSLPNDSTKHYYTSEVIKTSDRWRFYFGSGYGSGSMTVLEGQFYGRTPNEYIPLVPVMTSNTTPSGECSASSVYNNRSDLQPWKAFDGLSSTNWASATNDTVGATIGYKFPTNTKVAKVSVDVGGYYGGANTITKFKIQGFVDGAWVDISNEFTIQNSGESDYILDNIYNCTDFQLLVTGVYSGSTNVNLVGIQFYSKQAHTLIHSAVEDNIFYMDDGSPVALCGIPVGDTIDVDMESFKGQTLTLVSTVAKDPTNLSNDFSMNVRITPNITEVYLMPYGALYWWGHMYNCEDTTTANGWALTGTGSAVSFSAPTHNKNDITATSPSDYNWSGIGTKKLLGASVTKLKGVTVGISAGRYSEGEYLDIRANSGKTAPYSETYGQVRIKSASLTTTTANVTSANSFSAFLIAPWSSSGTIKAFWFE